MTTNRIPWWEPRIGEAEYRAVREVLDLNYLNEGETTSRFEQQLAAMLGVSHVVACTSGTTALSLALLGLGIRPGDEVIVPNVTFIATANAVSLIGAKPVLVDVSPETMNLCPGATKRALTVHTRAILPVHVSGRAADISSLTQVAQEHDLYLVEDAAEALLSRLDGRCLGTFGAAGCFSFSPHKTITMGQGGAVATNDTSLALEMRRLKDQGRSVRGTGGDDHHEVIGFNFKLTNLQAAVGICQLGYLEARTERLRQIENIYREQLSNLEGISLFGFQEGGTPQWVDAHSPYRNELVTCLLDQDVHCRRFWIPIHRQPPYELSDDAFPVSVRMSNQSFWLPSAFTTPDSGIHRVCQLIRKFLKGK